MISYYIKEEMIKSKRYKVCCCTALKKSDIKTNDWMFYIYFFSIIKISQAYMSILAETRWDNESHR